MQAVHPGHHPRGALACADAGAAAPAKTQAKLRCLQILNQQSQRLAEVAEASDWIAYPREHKDRPRQQLIFTAARGFTPVPGTWLGTEWAAEPG